MLARPEAKPPHVPADAFDWFPDWRGEPCAVIASGPSVTIEDVEKLRGQCHVIVVNNGFEIAPWADALYACDRKWWDEYREALSFAGLRITQDGDTAAHHRLHRIYLVEDNPLEFTIARKGYIAGGQNGGFQAINLAMQFGARPILGLGFDFCGEHWHGKHRGDLRNPREQTLARWASILDKQAATLQRMGVRFINCSDRSILTAYPKMSVDEALNELDGAVDLDAAEIFLKQAREAQQAGDRVKLVAARKLIAVALGLTDGPAGILHTKHLR